MTALVRAERLAIFALGTVFLAGPAATETSPAAVGATGGRVTAIALNDYACELPIEDFAKYNVIPALERDGQYMPVRDKGPLFFVYPYDNSPELRSQKFYSRSVWQVSRLVVK